MSHRTSKSTSKYSKTRSLLVTRRTFESVLELVGEKRYFLDSYILLALEIIMICGVLILSSRHLFGWSGIVDEYTKYAFMIVNFSEVRSNFYVWIGLFSLCCGWIGLIIGFFFITMYKSMNGMLLPIVAFAIRFTRTVLYIPLVGFLLSPLHCVKNDEGKIVRYDYNEYGCFELPSVMFMIVGVIFASFLFLVSAFDILFLLDKFRSLNLVTASPDGRFNFLIFFFSTISMVFVQVFSHHDIMMLIFGDSVLIVINLSLIILLLRLIPFYSIPYTFFVAFFLEINLTFLISSVILMTTKTWILSVSILIGIPIIIITNLVLIGRYVCMYAFFSGKKIRSNFLFSFFPVDVGVGLYVTKNRSLISQICCCFSVFSESNNEGSRDGILSRSSSKNKFRPSSVNNTYMTKIVVGLLSNSHFNKSKSICVMLIPLVINENLHLATSIMNHTKNISSTAGIDTEFQLRVYRKKIMCLQQVGNQSKKKTEMGQLDVLRIREEELKLLILLLLKRLVVSRDSKVSFSTFPILITSIQGHQEFCESGYERIVKKNPSPQTLRRYGNFIIKFLNDEKRAMVYLNEAKQLESPSISVCNKNNNNNAFQGPSIGNIAAFINNSKKKKKKRSRFDELEDMKRKSNYCEEAAAVDSDAKERYELTDEESYSFGMGKEVDDEEPNNVDMGNSGYCGEEEEDEVDDNDEDFQQDSDEQMEMDSRRDELTDEYDNNNILEESMQSNPDLRRRRRRKKKDEEEEEEEEEEMGFKTPVAKKKKKKRVVNLGRRNAPGTPPSERARQWSVADDWGNETFVGRRKQNKSNGANMQKIFKSVNNSWFSSVILIRMICILVFFACVFSMVSVFALSLYLESVVESNTELIKIASEARMSSVSSGHFVRKLQISSFPFPETYFPHERNLSSFRRRAYERCTALSQEVGELYSRVGSTPKSILRELILVKYKIRFLVNGATVKESDLIIYEGDHYHALARTSLMDVMKRYSALCLKVIQFDEETLRSDVQYNDDFFYVTENQAAIHDGLKDVLKAILVELEEILERIYILFFMIPCFLLVFVGLVFCGCVCYVTQQRNSFKGFLLIPQNEIQRIGKSLVGNDQDCESYTENSLEQRVSVSRCSMIHKFVIMQCLIIFLLVFLLVPFVILGSTSCTIAHQTVLEYDFSLRVKISVRRLHKWVVEFLYDDHTHFEKGYTKEQIKEIIPLLEYEYMSLRFGADEEGFEGNDGSEDLEPIYYEDQCTYDEDTGFREYEDSSNLFYELECLSLNNKMAYIIALANTLVDQNNTDPDLRASSEYERIIFLDNVSNGTIEDAGAIHEDLDLLIQLLQLRSKERIEVLIMFSNILIFIINPVFIMMYVICFCKTPQRLGRHLTYTKRIMMLLSTEHLSQPKIYNYFVGKTRYSSLSFKRVQKSKLEKMMDVLKQSYYAAILFDTKGNVLRFNESADSLLRITTRDLKTLDQLFTRESYDRIQPFFNSSSMKTLNNQSPGYLKRKKCEHRIDVTSVVDGTDVPLTVSFCKDEKNSSTKSDVIMAIFESLESSRRKEKLLFNFLPKEIAKKMEEGDETFMMSGENGDDVYVEEHTSATAFFCDICDFTHITTEMSPQDLVKFLHKFFVKIDDLLEIHFMEKIKTIGDCYFSVCGIPKYLPLHAQHALEFSMDVMKMSREQFDNLHIRIGLASGPVVAGIIGKKKWLYDAWGNTINEASRMEHYGIPDRIQVSRKTLELVEHLGFDFFERKITVEGIGIVSAYTLNEDDTGGGGGKVIIEVTDDTKRSPLHSKVKHEKIISSTTPSLLTIGSPSSLSLGSPIRGEIFRSIEEIQIDGEQQQQQQHQQQQQQPERIEEVEGESDTSVENTSEKDDDDDDDDDEEDGDGDSDSVVVHHDKLENEGIKFTLNSPFKYHFHGDDDEDDDDDQKKEKDDDVGDDSDVNKNNKEDINGEEKVDKLVLTE